VIVPLPENAAQRPGGSVLPRPGGRTAAEPGPFPQRISRITHKGVTTPADGSSRFGVSGDLLNPAKEAAMQPPSTTPTIGEARSREQGRGYGLVLFASILLLVIGCFNLIYGIAAVAKSHVFVANAHYVFGDLRSWGWITLILGALQLLAAAGVLAGSQAARWFAVAVIALNAIDQMFFIPAYPFWSLLIIAMDVIALYGLCAYGSRANLEAA
jgi:hypothetical protein